MRFSTSPTLACAALAALLCAALGCKKDSDDPVVPPPAAPSSPAISGMTPASGDVGGGETVTVNGSNFLSGATVSIGGSSATVQSVISTAIVVTTPTGSQGPATVVVTNPDTASATLTNGFTYTSGGSGGTPTISSTTPASGPAAGGTTITITGTGFVAGATVTVGGTAATGVVVVSGVQITAQTPAGTGSAQDVVVNNPVSGTATDTGAWTWINPPPTVTSLDVTSGPTTGGTSVNITGTGFLTGATVLFGSNAATGVVVNSATSISCSTPAGSAGSVTVTVTNTDAQSGQLAGAFTYTTGGGGTPTVTAISPSSGTTNGGTPVTITGTNFLVGATVTINSNAVTSVVVVNATTITGVTPAGTGTSLNVTVNNPGGGTGQAALWSYTASGTAPTVTSLSVSSGIAAGGTVVTINGSNFSTPTVTIDGVDQPVASSTGSTVVITTAGAGPCGPGGARDVKVTNGNGETGTGSALWTYTHNIPEGLGVGLTAPDIVVDGAGVIHVAFSADIGSNNSDVMYVRSTDGGKTWTSTPVRMSNSTNPSVTPKLAANGNTVVLVWDEQAGTASVQYTYSTDNGQNWQTATALPVGSANGLANAATPDIAIDANGTVTAAWVALGPTPPPPSLAGPDSQVWTASGSVTGITSATASQRSGTGTLIGGVAVAADGNGNAIVVWGQGFNGSVVQLPDDVYVTRTANSGASWATASQVHAGSSSSLMGGPAVALRGTSAVFVFCELTAGPNYACRSYRSTDTGASWSAGGTLRSAASTVVTTPAVAADANGWFMASWSHQGVSQVNIECALSSDTGSNWTTGQTFNPTINASSVPQIAGGAAGVFKHVWQEFNSGLSNGGDVRQW